jgi:hypothetical protein
MGCPAFLSPKLNLILNHRVVKLSTLSESLSDGHTKGPSMATCKAIMAWQHDPHHNEGHPAAPANAPATSPRLLLPLLPATLMAAAAAVTWLVACTRDLAAAITTSNPTLIPQGAYYACEHKIYSAKAPLQRSHTLLCPEWKPSACHSPPPPACLTHSC